MTQTSSIFSFSNHLCQLHFGQSYPLLIFRRSVFCSFGLQFYLKNFLLQLNLNCYHSMKLQIINRLSLNSNNNLDTIPTIRRQPDAQNNKKYAQFSSSHFEHNYYSIDSHCATNYAANGYAQVKNTNHTDNHRQFFNNFDILCTVKYEQTSKVEAKHKRRLQQQLRVLMMSSKSCTPKNNEVMHKLLIIQDNNWQKQKTKKLSSPLELRNYYLGQNKVKDKIRKISSMVSIRTDQSTDLYRKPGFILKKNHSLIKRQSTEQLTLIEDLHPNKQNINPNILTQPDTQKQTSSNVDRQIWQSKQRIARIRQELNEIYEMRKEPKCFKLKLF